MSALGQLAVELQGLTGETFSGSSLNRCVQHFEALAGATSYGSLAERMAEATGVLSASAGTPAVKVGDAYSRAASHIEAWVAAENVGASLTRLLQAISEAFAGQSVLSDGDGNLLVDGSGNTLTTTA